MIALTASQLWVSGYPTFPLDSLVFVTALALGQVAPKVCDIPPEPVPTMMREQELPERLSSADDRRQKISGTRASFVRSPGSPEGLLTAKLSTFDVTVHESLGK
jgi:hypothetical protein